MTNPVKAKLMNQDGGKDLEFMFNPTELSVEVKNKVNAEPAARTEKGLPKVTFAYPGISALTLNNLMFDTYETGVNVYTEYISGFCQALEFLGDKNRPPTYIFIWGSQKYLRCFVESVKYKLTLFLPDGTPVRATMDLTLKEVDDTITPGNTGTPNVSNSQRQSGGR